MAPSRRAQRIINQPTAVAVLGLLLIVSGDESGTGLIAKAAAQPLAIPVPTNWQIWRKSTGYIKCTGGVGTL